MRASLVRAQIGASYSKSLAEMRGFFIEASNYCCLIFAKLIDMLNLLSKPTQLCVTIAPPNLAICWQA